MTILKFWLVFDELVHNKNQPLKSSACVDVYTPSSQVVTVTQTKFNCLLMQLM